MQPADNKLYSFWLSGDDMSDRRKQSVEMLKELGLEFHLVTPKNLSEYIKEPLHEGYEYLACCHKSDYLRCHFMHFLGGAYADIKPPTGRWSESLKALNSSDSWFMGCEHHTAKALFLFEHFPETYGHRFADQSFICKPNSQITKEWYGRLIEVMDTKLEKLINTNVSGGNKYTTGKNYPIGVGEVLLDILYPVLKKYKEKTLLGLPPLDHLIYL